MQLTLWLMYLSCEHEGKHHQETKLSETQRFTCNTSGHVAGDVSGDQCSQNDPREVLSTRRSHGAKCSQLDAHPANASKAAKYVGRYQLRTLLLTVKLRLQRNLAQSMQKQPRIRVHFKEMFQIEAVQHVQQLVSANSSKTDIILRLYVKQLRSSTGSRWVIVDDMQDYRFFILQRCPWWFLVYSLIFAYTCSWSHVQRRFYPNSCSY